MGTILVKVCQLGGLVSEVCLVRGSTLKDALEAAELSAEGFEVKVNNLPGELGDEVFNSDTVILVPKIEGGNS